ncbi:uncharacterized protein LAESUDRAFT_708404 [Laetiporus sulphureus 93-53]|uniref:RecQ-mediated genome instability protein 1 n=1 Tax=Laetiporus sulphureus 93-53 TaxID=1314785 RepID=A0A165BDA5_9APHY|nr:uncharacterized protein LAESUDRAFT_708404 [Laetiporus sulphureus 93-53]KZT00791.1 hypothetical protein LAESUDRAFT_708404 [Laetiporus sulphureus 93-53]
MAPPIQIAIWLKRTYPQPSVDSEWLDGCYSWIESEFHFDPASQMQDIIRIVDMQLLESDLTDSMVAGTGLPRNVVDLQNTVIRGPILVQIISITDIGNSAFSLQSVRQARLERADMAGLARAEDEEDEGPIPSYPRSMLRFQLSDGSTTLQAIEYRRLPELVLGETKLGYKMILKNVSIRGGIALLEPKCVIMKGHQCADLDALQDRDFARGLRVRLGKPDDPALEEPQPKPEAALAVRQTMPIAAPSQAGGAGSIRSPFRELSEALLPPIAGPSGTRHDDEDAPLRRRKLPSRIQRSPSPNPMPQSQTNEPTKSRFFSTLAPGPELNNPFAALARERVFSPPRQPLVVVSDSSNDENDENDWQVSGTGTTRSAAGPSRAAQAILEPAPASSSSDYGYEDVDDALLREMERQEALVDDEETQLTQTRAPSTTLVGTVATFSQRTVTSIQPAVDPRMSASASVFTPGAGPSSTGAPGDSSSSINATGGVERVGPDVITIDDSEEDDKENVPVLARRVRRRVARLPASRSEGDVIELSD